jgi:hypothetical protein
MVTFADSLKQILYSTRAITGGLGLRPHSFTRVVRFAESSRSDVTEKRTPIVEGNGQPPKLRQMTSEETTVGQLNPQTWEAGPITPLFSGGGTDPAILRGDDLAPEDKLYFEIRGPEHPNGALFRRTKLTLDKALHFTMQLVPVEQSEF